MKVSTISWHYRLNALFGDYAWAIDMNLCKYFWRTVGVCLLSLVIISIVMFLIGVAIWNIVSYPYGAISVFIMTFLIVGCFILPPLAIAGLRIWLPPSKTAIPIPTVFDEYFKAIKRKYCPLIEFVDNPPS